jgi:hypothetical protein
MALRDIVGALRDEEFWRDIARNTRAMGELGIEFGEGAVGEVAGGITGLGKLATGSSFKEAGETMENVQDWAGSFYEPKYQETEDYMQSIGGAVQPLVEKFDTGATWLEDKTGGWIPRELTKGGALAALELSPLKFVPTGVPNALRRYDPNTNIGQTVPPKDVLGYTPDNLNFDYGDMPFDMAAPVATTGGSSAISNFIEKNVPLVTGLNVVPDSPRLSDALRTRKFNEDEYQNKFDELGFFSRALDEANNLKQKKGTGQQMKAMLLKAGVKQDEIDWTGLDKILDQPKVTKTEIVDYLNENKLKFKERVARGSSEHSAMDWGEPENIPGDVLQIRITEPITGMTIVGSDATGYNIFKNLEDSMDIESSGIFADTDINNINEAKVQAEMYAREGDFSGNLEELDRQFYGDKRTQWSEYQEPGGENYQEIQFTLASDELPVGSKAAEIDYESPHFENPDSDNMIFHIRATDRTTPDGKKVLYIEELQSDWAQRGRKTQRTEGFELKGEEKAKVEKRTKELKDNLNKKGKEVRNILAKADYLGFDSPDEMMHELKIWKKSAEKTDNVRWNEAFEAPELSANEIKIVDDFFDNFFKDRIEIEKLEKKLASDIPEGPFVGATDKWTSLAIKRLIAKAQKEGYDQISFSPGEVQVSSNRWPGSNLEHYYDVIIPKVAKEVTKKMDNVSVEKSDVGNIGANPSYTIDKDGSKNFDWPLPQRFTIKLSPDKEFEGFPYMSLAPISAAPIVESLRQEQPIY